MSSERLLLIDAPDESGRSTATLVANLAARLSLLHGITGAAALGSIVSGFAAIGREAARTAEGARLRAAIVSSRAGHNGAALWSSLRISEWLAHAWPAPLAEQLQNDVALLLAPDLNDVLELLPIPCPPVGELPAETVAPDAVDCIVGMWAFSRQLVSAVELLAQFGETRSRVRPGDAEPAPPLAGEVLR